MALSKENTGDMHQFIVEAIDTQIKMLIDRRYEAMKKEFLEQLERDKAEHLAGISILLMKQVDINAYNDRVIITLRTDNKNI